ncbi:MAG: DinB family protein [Bryobacteraceae bacterium]|nr:DinB family protein [Bryobacteraceae bacterium]
MLIPMSLAEHLRELARYNTVANRRLLEACAGLAPEEYRRERFGSFGSIERTLNHIMIGDLIWLARFAGEPLPLTDLGAILYDPFEAFRAARAELDVRMESVYSKFTDECLMANFPYVTTTGLKMEQPLRVLATHLLNHATHHRGQVHTMLSHAGVKAPSLDMHYILDAEVLR